MPPQTQPIDKRTLGLTKILGSFQNESARKAKDAQRQQKAESNARAKERAEELKHSKALTAQAAQRAKFAKQAALGGSGGGGPGPTTNQGAQRFGGGRTSTRTLGMRTPALKAIPGLVAGAALGGVIGIITSQVREALDQFGSTAKVQRNTAGMFKFNNLTSLVNKAKDLGFDPDETLKMVSGVGKAVGVNKPGDFPQGALQTIREAQINRGMSPEELIQLMGGLRKSGTRGFDTGQAGLRTVSRIMADATASGLEKTRVAEHIANVDTGMKAVGEAVSGAVDVAGLSKILAELGQLGSGFQGERISGIQNSMQQTFMQAGRLQAPDAVQAFLLRHVGKYGGPDTENDLWAGIRQLEKGFTPENVHNTIRGAIRDTGGGPLAARQLQASFQGLSFTKAEKLIKHGEGGFQSPAEFQKLIKEAKPETQSADEKMLETAKQQAEIAAEQFNNGKEIYKTTADIQLTINKMVTDLLPLIKSLLEVTLEFTQDFKAGWDWLKEKFGSTPSQQSPETTKRMLDFKALSGVATPEVGLGKLQNMVADQADEVARLKRAVSPASFAPDGDLPVGLEGAEEALDEMRAMLDRVTQRENAMKAVEAAQVSARQELEKVQAASRAEIDAKYAAAVDEITKGVKTISANSKDEPGRRALAQKAATEAGVASDGAILP